MTSNTSASRSAQLALVVIGIIGVVIWFFWMSGKEIINPESSTATEKNGSDATERRNTDKSVSTHDKIKDVDPVADVTHTALTESEVKEAQSNSRSSNNDDDFRVIESDNYASVTDGRFFTTTGITDLNPNEEIHTFRIGQRVYAYAAIHAPRKETVRITWFESNNKEIPPSAYLDVLVNTGPVGYRVFTYRTFRASGKYNVKMSNSVGVVIGVKEFEVF
jgi:cytoskeletal protein RodZ